MGKVEPLPERLRRLRKERGLSQESLAFEMYRAGRNGATAGAIGQFERGLTHPKPETIEAIAAALKVEPTEFFEYRLALVRQLFDERAIGLEEAARNLEALDEAGQALVRSLDAEFAQQMKAALPSGSSKQRSRTRPAKRQRKRA